MSLLMKSVNWCSSHRINFPCDKQCPECISAIRQKISMLPKQESHGYTWIPLDYVLLLLSKEQENANRVSSL